MKKIFYLDDRGNKTEEKYATNAIVLDTITGKETFIDFKE